MDRGAWQATVHGVTRSRTRLSNFTSSSPTPVLLGFPGGSVGRRIHLQCGRAGFDPGVGKILWRRERLPAPVFWPGEFHGLYSPQGSKESDMTEQLSLSMGQSLKASIKMNETMGSSLNRNVERKKVVIRDCDS